MGDEAAPGRKDWIENRLKEPDQIFAVSVGGFSLMDNHLHLLLRIDPEVANGWSDSEVVERWFRRKLRMYWHGLVARPRLGEFGYRSLQEAGSWVDFLRRPGTSCVSWQGSCKFGILPM